MLILLPPSEGKTAAEEGEPVDFAELSFPELTEARERVVEVLAEVSAHEDALSILSVGKSLAAEVERNRWLLAEPAQPAWQVYTGVLFEALDYGSLNDAAAAAANSSLLVFSALWGALSLADRIPAYRLSMNTKLADCGNLATFWRGELGSPLDSWVGDQLVLDCRSAAYAKAWVPNPSRTYAIRVEKQLEDGSRKVVSHMAKYYRGLLARAVLEAGISQLDDIYAVVKELSDTFSIELTEPQATKQGVLTLVVAN